MIVRALEFENFRNLDDNRIFPSEKVNVIYGDNAQGKTNLLEALWLFSGGHSFRGAKESELCKFGSNYSLLKMDFLSQQRGQNAVLRFKGNKKEIEINGVKKPSSAYLCECFAAVVFSPEHLSLIKNGPSLRRKFIDTALCQQDIKFAVLLSKYNRTVFQRNTLLKDMKIHPELKDTLCIWDDALIASGSKIIKKRIEFIRRLGEYAEKYHFGISSNAEKLEMNYLSDCGILMTDSESEIRDKLSSGFEKNLREDIYTGCTGVGPHRDDLDFLINGVRAKSFASQGQQRSVVLSLKLSEAAMLREVFGEPPIILLDDVLSEIDRGRQEYLLSNTGDCQTFITGCETPLFIKDGTKTFMIEKGVVR